MSNDELLIVPKATGRGAARPGLRWLRRVPVVALAIGLGGLVACSSGSDDAAPEATDRDSTPTPAGEPVVVYRTPTCGCCEDYVEYLRTHGFEVESEVVDDTESVRAQHGLPDEAASCHTTVIGDYAVEGHVPVTAIEELLEERPDVDGIAVPGMPADSPGMGGDGEGLEVLSVDDGRLAPFTTA